MNPLIFLAQPLLLFHLTFTFSSGRMASMSADFKPHPAQRTSRLIRRHLRSIWASTSRCAPAHAILDRHPSPCCACHFDGHHSPDDRSALPHPWLGTHCHLLC